MSQLDDLKSAIKSRLGELECVIGWGAGYDPLHATPLFIPFSGLQRGRSCHFALNREFKRNH